MIQATDVILPPATIAILGGGQLGAMLAEAARRMGYRTVCVSASEEDPAGRWSDHHVVGDPSDVALVRRLARDVQVVTVETEGIAPEALTAAAELGCRVAPSAAVQQTVRDRRLEKTFFRDHNLPVGAFCICESAAQVDAAIAELLPLGGGTGVVAKTARGGYDGKGQRWIKTLHQGPAVWEALGHVPLVLEAAVPFVAEASVIVARSADGRKTALPMFQNEHRGGILFQTRMPGSFEQPTLEKAVALAEATADKLDVVGLITVEMFVLRDGRVLANELAARPHNSGHVTLRAASRSQFEMHIAALCGLPLPPVQILRPGVMTNLLGDLWAGGHPDWTQVLRDSSATLHLYGKGPRPGRKMGHMIHTAADINAAKAMADRAFGLLNDAVARRNMLA
ncbi:MAG: 5-(carboxyamino)imidazole ribonucleotide synthase [Phycisphaerae bacterium]